MLVAACSNDARYDQVLGTLERDRLELIAEASEPIIEIAAQEGDVVTAGTVLLKLETTAVRARLDQAVAARSMAERRLAQLVSGPRAQEIAEARAALEAAQSLLVTETSEYGRDLELLPHGLVSQSSVDQSRARRDNAAGQVRQAEARLKLLLEGTRIEEIEQAEASLQQARAALAELDTHAARYTVSAPRPGRIEAIPYKLGERPAQGAPVMVMLADGVPYARVYVPETRRAQFTPGTRVRVTVDGRDTPFTGVVRFISADAAFTPYYALTQEDRTRLSYLAEIDLIDEAAQGLPSGIPLQVVLPAPDE
jgi:HlyD family secretion protein